ANRPCYSSGFPSDVRGWIDEYIAGGREIDVVAFGPGGRWIVVAEDYLRRTNNVSDEIMEDIRHAQSLNRRITSVAFSANPDNGYVITAGQGGYWSDETDADIRVAIAAASQGQRAVHEAAIAPDGSWVVVAEDWFATKGASASLLEQMERYRTEEERRIDHVVLHPGGGENLWALISNVAEPTPDAADLINLVEHGLPGDSSIYQRMKLHDVVGASVAVIVNNEVAWARGYGLREFDVPETYVYPNTIFDAASISKPVSYAGLLQLVEDGDIPLTEGGIFDDLYGDELPIPPAIDNQDEDLVARLNQATLANILNHCAGIDHAGGGSGAQGILPGSPLPTTTQLFLGTGPASTGNRIVVVDTVEVGERLDYSGANSLLIQALMDHHASGGYDGQMERLLDDLGMRLSTFKRDFWEGLRRERFAFGHTDNADGSLNKTEVKIYPNQVAANLRTTVLDLANFVIMLNQGGMFDGQQLLEAATVDQFVGRDGIDEFGPPLRAVVGVAEAACAIGGTMRLGIRSDNLGDANETFFHGGLHNGYRTGMYGYPQRQLGLIIFLTGDAGVDGIVDKTQALRQEILQSFWNAYL
ncbi:MAG: serine hydrolase, partial [Rubricoccaceae bacterium]|nr:serine hydrolase [Rubricoccaceae bacterium]